MAPPRCLYMTANDRFTRGFHRLTTGWVNLRAFREVAELGLPLAAPSLESRRQQDVQYLMQTPDWPNVLKRPEEFQKRGGANGMASQMTAFSLKSAPASVDAASLVFAHSFVDAALMDFLYVTSIACPKDWEQFLDCKKQWTVAEVRQSGYELLFSGLLDSELRNMERNSSLPTKGEKLRQLCRPEESWTLPCQYDKSELSRIDELRHSIVHRDPLGEGVPSIATDLKFLEEIGLYFLMIVHNRYSTKLVFDA